MVEWDGLENRCGPRGHRGFESLPLRQLGNGSPAVLHQKNQAVLNSESPKAGVKHTTLTKI